MAKQVKRLNKDNPPKPGDILWNIHTKNYYLVTRITNSESGYCKVFFLVLNSSCCDWLHLEHTYAFCIKVA